MLQPEEVSQILRGKRRSQQNNIFMLLRKLIGGGDDEWELKGPLPEPTQADPLPLSTYTIGALRKTFLRQLDT